MPLMHLLPARWEFGDADDHQTLIPIRVCTRPFWLSACSTRVPARPSVSANVAHVRLVRPDLRAIVEEVTTARNALTPRVFFARLAVRVGDDVPWSRVLLDRTEVLPCR